jgi:YidC/Oxa1 family membrane protein insertase
MKFMLYGMPIIFFFILYNVPSGLTFYWIMSNILSMVQQLIINKAMAQKKAALIEEMAAKDAAKAAAEARKRRKR